MTVSKDPSYVGLHGCLANQGHQSSNMFEQMLDCPPSCDSLPAHVLEWALSLAGDLSFVGIDDPLAGDGNVSLQKNHDGEQ